MNADPKDVLADLKQGKYHPIYFLQGEEPFYIDQIADYIENKVLDEAQKSFNQTVLYGKEVKVNDVLTQARRFPMMSDRQVVIVREAQSIFDINREGGQKILSDYVSNPLRSTILVFCHKNKTLDKRKSLYKTLKKSAVVVETKKLYENQIPSWIKERVSSMGMKITDKAVMMLAQNIGSNMERINNELEKVAINVKSDLIDEDMVQTYVGISRDFNVFELQKALGNRDRVKAQHVAFYLGENSKENPLVLILGFLFSFFSKVLKMHGLQTVNDKGLMSALGTSFLSDYKIAFKNYSASELVRIIGYIRNADLQSKGIDSPSLSETDILKELVSKIVS